MFWIPWLFQVARNTEQIPQHGDFLRVCKLILNPKYYTPMKREFIFKCSMLLLHTCPGRQQRAKKGEGGEEMGLFLFPTTSINNCKNNMPHFGPNSAIVLVSKHITNYPGPRGFLSPRREYQATDKEAVRENLWLPTM